MTFKRWFKRSVKHSPTGSISAYDVLEAYYQSTGNTCELEYAMNTLSSSFEMYRDTFTNETLARAIIIERYDEDDTF
jgi:hypothetical protein